MLFRLQETAETDGQECPSYVFFLQLWGWRWTPRKSAVRILRLLFTGGPLQGR
jgi:hypothetical protein